MCRGLQYALQKVDRGLQNTLPKVSIGSICTSKSELWPAKCVSKIDGEQLKENPSILYDNINTLNVFSKKKFILLDIMHITITKNLESTILEAIKRNI